MVSKLHSELKSITGKLEHAEEYFTSECLLRGLNAEPSYRQHKSVNVARYKPRTKDEVIAAYRPKRNLVVLKLTNGKLPEGIIKVQKVYGKDFYRVVAREELFPEIKNFFEQKKTRVMLASLEKFKTNYLKKTALNGRQHGTA